MHTTIACRVHRQGSTKTTAYRGTNIVARPQMHRRINEDGRLVGMNSGIYAVCEHQCRHVDNKPNERKVEKKKGRPQIIVKMGYTS